MKTQTIIRAGVAALALTVAAACGDSGDPSYDSEMSEEEAGMAGEATHYTVQSAFQAMNFGYATVGVGAPPALTRLAAAHGARPHAAPRWTLDPSDPAALGTVLQAALADGCTYSGSGSDGDIWDPIDMNENGVPDDWSVLLTCVETDEPSEGVTRVETTKYDIRIKEHTDDLHGFDASAKYTSHEDYSNGDDEQFGIEQSQVVSVHPLIATGKVSIHQWEKVVDGGALTSLEIFFDADLLFDADGTIEVEEDAFPDGDFTIDGSVRILSNLEGNVRFELSTPEPWQYSSECDDIEGQGFIGGTLLGLLNGDEEIGWFVTWGSCGDGFDFGIIGDGPEPPLPPEVPHP